MKDEDFEHPDLADEVNEVYFKKMGNEFNNMSYAQSWSLKGRIVQGKRTNLGRDY